MQVLYKIESEGEITMNDKYIRIWKDMVAVYCKQFSQITFGVTKENKEGCEVGRNPADIRI
jgi:hypothetical protein